MTDILESIERHKNIIQSSSSTIASIGLEKAGYKVGGTLVTPAIWAANYATNRNIPDNVDLGLYATGFLGTVASAAAVSTGMVKAIVDDDIDRKLKEVRNSENQEYRNFIHPCYRYGMMAPQINATTIASRGGTAWKHPNGLWVYITDAQGYNVDNYQPKKFVLMYRPKHPLRKGRNGLFLWESIR